MISLNDRQKEAVESLEGPVLVLAGAGSGKTRVLTQRIARLIENGVSPFSILAITFTNKAANEMRSRVEDIVDFDITGMWISTFHSMCVRILRIDCGAIGYSPGFSIYDSDDTLRIIKKVLDGLGLKDDKEYSPRLIRSAVSRYKNSGMKDSPELFAENHYPFISYRFGEIYEKYENQLKSQNAMDFDDLLLNTFRLFKSNQEILNKYQKRFRYILVDEYQDTNDIQYRLVKMLSEAHKNIFVVGDDDQSIYAFRGAEIKNILNFEKDFLNAKKISLEQNYRSDIKILDVANCIIKNNPNRNKKVLWSDIRAESRPVIYYARNEYDEADYVAGEILRLNSEGVPYSDMAVFYRANYLSRLIEERLRGNSIPYRVYGSVSFYEKMEIKDITSYLTLIVNPDSDVAFLRSINTPKRGIGPVTLRSITDLATERSLSLYEASKMFAENSSGALKSKLSEYIEIIEKYRKQMYEVPAHIIIEGVINDIPYVEMLESSYYDDSEMRIANIEEFVNSAYQMETSDENIFLNEFLQNITLITDLDTADDEGVSLMTIHMAKGLEFNTVFIIGMNEDIFPNQKAVSEGEIEEERRLCYVAITRAKRNLFMIGAKTRMLFGNTVNNDFSCFLDEIDEGLCDIEGTVKSTGFELSLQAKGIDPLFLKDYKPQKSIKQVKDKDTSVFEIGTKVRHSKFGKGIIKSISGSGDYKVAVIDFDNNGQKKMFLSMAPLTIEV